MPGHGVGKQGFEQGRTFRVLDPPSNDAAATDVEDDVEIETGLYHRSHQFGDVPRPVAWQGMFTCLRRRPDWGPRQAVRAFDKLDGGAGSVVPQPAPGRQRSDTSCGPCKDSCLHRAGLRRPQSGSGRQSAGSVVKQALDRARFLVRRAVTVHAVFPSGVALAALSCADAHWRVTPQVPRRWPSSIGCPGSKPQPPPSRFAAAAGRLLQLVQQCRYFFCMAMMASA